MLKRAARCFWAGEAFLLFLFINQNSMACEFNPASSGLVVVGDSHSTGGFGERLILNLTTTTQKPQRFAVAGSAANHWNMTDNEFLRQLKIVSYCPGDGYRKGVAPEPNFPVLHEILNSGLASRTLIIALGSNDIGWNCKKPLDQQMFEVQRLLDQIPARLSCIWIGPPTFETGVIVKSCGVDRIHTFIQQLGDTVSSRCLFIDSRTFLAPRKLNEKGAPPQPPQRLADCYDRNRVPLLPNAGDGVHFVGALAQYWADCVNLEIVSQ